MRLFVEINNQKFLVLIDTWSTHSFIYSYVARKAKLSRKASQLTVQVANSIIIPCLGHCKTVSFKLHDHQLKASLYVLTLGGCVVVLGVDWLSGLRPIL